jgi:8-oxo-dGTP pyrophosphatase MutT (NUDIX family)
MNYAAGIIPYTITDGVYSFLLGYESRGWSGFAGGCEDTDLSIEHTAIREFHEETANIFLQYPIDLKYSRLCKDKTPSGKNMYIWFVQFPEQFCLDAFEENTKRYQDVRCYIEKSKLQWFTLDEIKKRKDIFYLSKKRILKLTN